MPKMFRAKDGQSKPDMCNLSVTDGVYGVLSDLDVKEQISALEKSAAGSEDKKELIDLLKQLVRDYEISTQ
jgi:hypothetical protein